MKIVIAYMRTQCAPQLMRALHEAGVTDLGWGDPMKWVAEPTG